MYKQNATLKCYSYAIDIFWLVILVFVGVEVGLVLVVLIINATTIVCACVRNEVLVLPSLVLSLSRKDRETPPSGVSHVAHQLPLIPSAEVRQLRLFQRPQHVLRAQPPQRGGMCAPRGQIATTAPPPPESESPASMRDMQLVTWTWSPRAPPEAGI